MNKNQLALALEKIEILDAPFVSIALGVLQIEWVEGRSERFMLVVVRDSIKKWEIFADDPSDPGSSCLVLNANTRKWDYLSCKETKFENVGLMIAALWAVTEDKERIE